MKYLFYLVKNYFVLLSFDANYLLTVNAFDLDQYTNAATNYNGMNRVCFQSDGNGSYYIRLVNSPSDIIIPASQMIRFGFFSTNAPADAVNAFNQFNTAINGNPVAYQNTNIPNITGVTTTSAYTATVSLAGGLTSFSNTLTTGLYYDDGQAAIGHIINTTAGNCNYIPAAVGTQVFYYWKGNNVAIMIVTVTP